MKTGLALTLSHALFVVSLAFVGYSLRVYLVLADIVLPSIEFFRPASSVAASSVSSSPAVSEELARLHGMWSSQAAAHLEFARNQLIAWGVVLLASFVSIVVLHRARHNASRAG